MLHKFLKPLKSERIVQIKNTVVKENDVIMIAENWKEAAQCGD